MIINNCSNSHNPPSYSILIVCWNSNQYLKKCLQSIRQQTLKDFEIILLDNASPQPVPTETIEEFNDLTIQFYKADENLGFAGGNNLAASKAVGKYLITLNADAFPENNWLEVIHQATLKYPNHSFASKLIMDSDRTKLDGAGDVYHFTGLVWRRYFGKPLSCINLKEEEVFSPCGAAAIYPRDFFYQVGGFDDDFFAYVEDIDLGFRLQLAGCPCIFLPEATVYHVGSGSTEYKSDFSVYYGNRNLIWAFFKNMPFPLLIFLLPFHFLANIGLVLNSIFLKQGRVTIKAKKDAVFQLKTQLQKRKFQQKSITLFQLKRSFNWSLSAPAKRK